MISFLISIAVLIIGYFVYGKFIEKVLGVDKDRKTPAVRLRDDMDFVPLPTWKVFLIQFLNIAGLGPIFGAIAGAMFGPDQPVIRKRDMVPVVIFKIPVSIILFVVFMR